MEWYVAVLKNYVEFSGRARRKEYWMFVLISSLISLVLNMLGSLFNAGSVLGLLYSLAVLLPSVAVAIRRLHDTSRSGWMSLLALIPIVGWIILLVFACQDSTPGSNAYGPNPKETVIAALPA